MYAQHTSTGANSDWSNAAAWDQGSVPTASDNVIINHAITVTAANAVCNNLTVNYNGGSGSLTISGDDAKVDAGGTGTIGDLLQLLVVQLIQLHSILQETLQFQVL